MIPLSPANSSGVSWSKLARSGGFEVERIGSAVGAREYCGSQFDVYRGQKTHFKECASYKLQAFRWSSLSH
jgi:hypothetical protein